MRVRPALPALVPLLLLRRLQLLTSRRLPTSLRWQARFSQFTTSSSDTTKATISATSSASLGSYQLAVTNLASAQTLASGTFTATSDTLGTGTLTIAIGTPSYSGSTYSSFSQTSSVDITIDSSNNTLSGVRDAINNAGAGVNASILKNGDNYQLLLVSERRDYRTACRYQSPVIV